MTSSVNFPGRFGKLCGTWTAPERTAPFPAVLLCQGLSGVKDLVLPEVARRLACAGYASLAFDYAGFGESEGDGSWIDPTARLMDAHMAFRYLRQRGDVGRVAVYGLSLGGGIALGLAAECPSLSGAVSVSGFASGTRLLMGMRAVEGFLDLKARLQHDPESLVDLDVLFPFPASFRSRYDGLKKSDAAVQSSSVPQSRQFRLASADCLMGFDLSKRLATISPTPILVQHGALDDVIPIEDALDFFRNLGEPKELRVHDGYDHIGLDTGPGFEAQVAETIRFLDRYLKRESPATSG